MCKRLHFLGFTPRKDLYLLICKETPPLPFAVRALTNLRAVNLYKVLAFKGRLKGVNFAPRGCWCSYIYIPSFLGMQRKQMLFLNTQISGELKANAFFALLVKTEKNRFYSWYWQPPIFFGNSTILNKKNTPANVRGCKP